MNDYISITISVVAVVASLISAIFVWRNAIYERKSWLVELKQQYSLEIYKSRIAHYPALLSHLLPLSTINYQDDLTKRAEVAHTLNEWLYNCGGLIAEKQLRNCIVNLRNKLLNATSSVEDIKRWKHMTIFFLRYDIDILGLEHSTNPHELGLLSELKERVEGLVASKKVLKSELIGRFSDGGWHPSKKGPEADGCRNPPDGVDS